jgi:hypothetical protein
MTLPISVQGARVVVPGVYSTLTVQDNLANVSPGPRNIVLVGEAAKGVPGSLLDLSGLFFTDYESLRAYFGTGAMVDAARMAFQNQASPVFAGSVNRVYCYKTNQSGRAERPLAQGGLFGAIVAAEYGEAGNLISSQVADAASEIKPTFTARWVMSNAVRDFRVRVSGGAELSVSAGAEVLPSAIVTSLDGLAGVSATGGVLKEIIAASQVGTDTLAVVVDGTYPDRISINCSAPFVGADYAALVPGDVLYIPVASAIAGVGSENGGAWVVVSKTASAIVCDKISSSTSGGEVAHIQPAAVAAVAIAGSQTAAATAELLVSSPMVVSVDAATVKGSGASLEVYMPSGAAVAGQRWWIESQLDPVSAATSASASVALAVSGASGTFSISGGAFSALPKVGEVVWVSALSVLRGSAGQNIGAWIVTSAGSTAVVAQKLVGTPVAVASVLLAGQTGPFRIQAQVASTSIGAKTHISAVERQVRIQASRQSDGLVFPAASIGGRVVLEVGYVGTTATLEITKAGRLKTTVSGGSGVALDIQLARYATLGELVALINSQTGYKARVVSNAFNSLAPRLVLDNVASVGIAAGHAVNAMPGRVKSDYADFKKFVDDNFGLIAFRENPAILAKAGLPDAEPVSQFLAGGSLGGTSNADVLAGLDACLKIEVTQVLPLFSRDAFKDVEDGYTDSASSYSIDAINSALKSHVLTASGIEYRRERFGMASFHGTFEQARAKAAELSSERVQMVFQQGRAVGAEGAIRWFLPWMGAVAVAAGRVQAPLGTPMLRKSFQLTSVKHVGDESLFSDKFTPDFDPDTKDLDQAIEAGLVVLRPVTGFGIRMESPDLSTRSRENDPKGWVFERMNVQFVLDEVLKTARTTLENYIGSRTTDVSPSVVRKSLEDALRPFVSAGSLRRFSIDKVILSGNQYRASVSVFPVEAVEAIVLDVYADREVGESA